jgi:hypothetical protein
MQLGCGLGLYLDSSSFTPCVKVICEILVDATPMDKTCICNVIARHDNKTIQQSAGLVALWNSLYLILWGSHQSACLVRHHCYANFCQPVLLKSIIGCLLKHDSELPIVALGHFLELKVFSAILHSDNINLVPILLPFLELFTCQPITPFFVSKNPQTSIASAR